MTRPARWAAASLLVVALSACTPAGDVPDPAVRSTAEASPTPAATPGEAAPVLDAGDALRPAGDVARLSVVAFGAADGTDQQTQVKVVPEVQATGDVDVRTWEGDFWLVVDPAAVPSWQGLLPGRVDAPEGYAEAWTMPTADGRGLGMLPANPSGMSAGGGQQHLVTRWNSWSVPAGGSSSDADGGPGSLVFHVPQRDDGSLGVLGLALLDAERRPVAFVDVGTWAPETDPTTF